MQETSRPLGKFEQAQTITSELAPFNVVAAVSLEPGPDPEILRQALDSLQLRHPLFNARILSRKKAYIFQSGQTPAIPLQVIPRSQADQWRSVVETELNLGIDISRGPLLRFIYLVPDHQNLESELIVTLHHSIVDGVSLMRIFHELLLLCEAIKHNQSIENTPPLTLLPSQDDFLPPKFKSFFSKSAAMMNFAGRQIRDEIEFRRSTRGQRQAPRHISSTGKIIPVQMSAEATKNLIRGTRKRQVTLHSTLCVAMMMALAESRFENKDVVMRHVGFIDLRPYLKPPVPKDRMGNYISMVRITVPVNPNGSLWEQAGIVNDLIYTLTKRGDKFIYPMISPQMMRMAVKSKTMRVGSTALSYAGIAGLQNSYGEIQVNRIHTYVSNLSFGPEYTAVAHIFQKKLCWNILYLEEDMERPAAEKIAERIVDLLSGK